MPKGPRVFLANSGRVWATALRPVPPKKRPCAIHARKVGRASNTADQSRSEPLQVSGSTSAGRVICGTDLAECVSVPGDFLRPQLAFPPGFYLLREGWVNRPTPEAPLTRGMPPGPRAFLANSGRVWATALRPVPPKKGLVPYMPVRWGVHQIPQTNLDLNLSSCRVALRPAVLSAARICPSVSRCLEISFGLRGLSPQAFTSFGRVGLIARRLRRP